MFWFAPNIEKLVIGGVAGILAGIIISVIIDRLITPAAVRETVRQKTKGMPRAFKYKIMEAKDRAVRVGIFDSNTELLKKIEIKSDKGVAPGIQVNKWEYL